MIKDPVADMANRIKIASINKFVSVEIPYSKFKYSIAKALSQNGFVWKIALVWEWVEKNISIQIIDWKITQIKLMSKSWCRMYISSKDIKSVKWWYWLSLISTSEWVMSWHRARFKNIWWEFLFVIY